jgi:tetratricopeptide (TPR) repeat protein
VEPIPAAQVIERLRNLPDRADQWPARGKPNRLEPECWPELRPRFKIQPGCRVFTTGSCFARNIEMHLANLEFDVPAISLMKENPDLFRNTGTEVLNKYTPASIYQELAWARNIYDRDDQLRFDDIRPLLLDLGNDRYLDMHSRVAPVQGATEEELFTSRRILYELTRTAFSCDVAVITLGLIETWWDATSGLSIEFNPKMLRHSDPDRFYFRRIRYDEAYRYVTDTIALITSGTDTKILLTTSPVPLGRTFTTDDVIIANTYSKSVLRAVSGAICEDFDCVDYFPSYESVLLTKQEYVWSNDLVHIESTFVGRIMARVVDSYVSGSEVTPLVELAMTFSQHIKAAEWDLAKPLYAKILALGGEVFDYPALCLGAAEYEAAVGDPARAIEFVLAAEKTDGLAVEPGAEYFLRCAKVHERFGNVERGSALRKQALDAIGGNKIALKSLFIVAHREGRVADALWLMAYAEEIAKDDPATLAMMREIYRAENRPDDAMRIQRYLVEADPSDVAAHLRFASDLVEAGQPDDGLTVLRRLGELVPGHPIVSRRLAVALIERGQMDEADAVIHRRLAEAPDDSVILGTLAQVHARRHEFDEALTVARSAIGLGNTAPGLQRLVDRLIQRAGAPT